MELLERYDQSFEQCSAAMRKFSENHNFGELMISMDALTEELTDAMKLP
jgi:hypothetical protein